MVPSKSLALIEKLISFDTTSRESNLQLISFVVTAQVPKYFSGCSEALYQNFGALHESFDDIPALLSCG